VRSAERTRRILVTGGAGFIGSHLVDAYLDQGHQVAVLDDLSSGERRLVAAPARFYEGDVTDAALIEQVFTEFAPEVVNHHAAQMDVRRSVADPTFDARVNILGSLVLLDACVRHGTGRFIFASSGGAIYGEQSRFPADESHPTQPLSPYGVSKLAVEKYLHAWHYIHGLSFAALRYANVYGPRQSPFGEAGVVAIFAHRMLAGQEPVINGDGLQTRDYVYVGDVVAANLAALDGPETVVVNIGTGSESSVVDIYRGVAAAVGWGGRETHGPAQPGEQRRSVIDPVHAWEQWGWRPQVPLEEGLKRTIRYFRRAREAAGEGGRIRGESL
jgi:UDP-glucose 4-epimerase